MKLLTSILITLFSFCIAQAQTSPGLSIGALYEGDATGLSAEISYNHKLYKSLNLVARLQGNNAFADNNRLKTMGYSVGLSMTVIKNKTFEIATGLEYNYLRTTLNEFSEDLVSHNLLTPIQIGVNLSKRLQLYGGVSLKLDTSNKIPVIDTDGINRLRLGINLKL